MFSPRFLLVFPSIPIYNLFTGICQCRVRKKGEYFYMEHITKTSQLRDLLHDSSKTIQEKISASTVDADTKILLDSIAQQTHYVLSGIIEYLDNH